MTGRDFLACAEWIASGSTEAGARSAVSRAYYGAFHEARASVAECGVGLPRTEQVHVKLIFLLRDCGDANSANVAQQLDLLKNQRKRADYELDDSRFADGRLAKVELAKARAIVDRLALCRPDAVFRSRIRAHAKLLGLPVAD